MFFQIQCHCSKSAEGSKPVLQITGCGNNATKSSTANLNKINFEFIGESAHGVEITLNRSRKVTKTRSRMDVV